MRLLLCLLAALPATAFAARPSGENAVGAPRAEYAAAQHGMELVYQRRYSDALEHFEETQIDFPDSPLGAVGRQIVWQAKMFETNTFDFERAYLTDAGEADDRFRASRRDRSRKDWNRFLFAVHSALGAMYDIRHDRNVAAFDKAWDAMEAVKEVHRSRPEFEDLQLAFGLYNYWRTVMTRRIEGLPPFADKTGLGIEQMIVARDKGTLASAPARLALTYTYYDARDFDSALAEAAAAQRLYPTNLLNQMILGRTQSRKRDYASAEITFRQATTFAPEYWEAHYRLARTIEKDRKRRSDARVAYDGALAAASTPRQQAQTAYRRGLLERAARKWDDAMAWFERSVGFDPTYEAASKRLAITPGEKARWEERKSKRVTKTKGSSGYTPRNTKAVSAQPR
jgi:tetratricopeptide (TPR) repeat protein